MDYKEKNTRETIEKVEATIARWNMLNDVRHLVVGFSGGPDSMCLLDILIELSKDLGIEIHPVHINHNIRKGVSDEEARFCENYSEERGLKAEIFSYDCEALAAEEKISTEEMGRKLRYDSFGEVASRYENCKVAVAHNMNDRVETVLMRILRGTGVDGLSGIPYVRKDERGYEIIRPILDLGREEILSYCEAEGLNPCMDATNMEPVYRRNDVRLNLIPLLKEKYNPEVEKAIIRLAESSEEDSSYLKSLAEKALKDSIKEKRTSEFLLDGDALRVLPVPVRKRVFSAALRALGLREDLGSNHYEAWEGILTGERPSASVSLPGGFYVRNVYKDIELGRDNEAALPEISVSVISKDEFDRLELPGRSYAAFDLKKLRETYGASLPDNLVIRKREPGDVIKLKIGTKKIQDLMVDLKISKFRRDEALVAAVGSSVLWFISSGFRDMRWAYGMEVDAETEEVLLLK